MCVTIVANAVKANFFFSDSCHRSKNSWTNFVFEKLEIFSRNTPTHFTYLACAGASVDNGILNGIGEKASQIDIIEKIAKIRSDFYFFLNFIFHNF